MNQGVVAVISHPADHAVAEVIRATLVERGVDARIAGAGDRLPDAMAIVVVLSPALCADAEVLQSLAPLRGKRLVPVQAASLTAGTVPEFLAELNWILWDSSEPAARNAALLTAVNSDAGRYRENRSLEAEAAAWESSGFDPDYLVSDRRAVRNALSHNSGVHNYVLSAPSERLEAYLAASDRATRRAWWKRNRRWAFRAAVVIGVVVISVTGWQTITEQRAANLLAVALFDQDDDERGDLPALKLAGLIEQQSAARRTIPESAVGRVMSLMAFPWDSGLLTSGRNLALNAFAITGPETVLIADGHGGLSSVSTEDGSVAWRRAVSDDILVALAAAPDGGVAFVADAANVVHRVDTQTWTTETQLVSDPVERLVLATPDRAVASLTTGAVVEIAFGEGAGVREIGRWDKVFDLEATAEGAVRILVRAGPALQVIDPLSGFVEAEQHWEETEFERGALYPGQGVALAGRDNQLWFAAGGLNLMPTGVATPDIVRTIAVTPLGAVFFASDAFGAQLLDPRTQTTVRVCTTLDHVDSVTVSADGTQLICGAKGIGVLSNMSELLSTAAEPELDSHSEQPAAQSDGPIDSAEIDDEHRLIVTVDGERLNLLPDTYTVGNVVFGPDQESAPIAWIPGAMLGGGQPTVVALTSDGATLAVGTSTGVVSVLDTNEDGLLALASRWTAPDRHPVTALGFSGPNQTLAIRTDSDRWWSTSSCAGCGRDTEVLLDAVAARLWFCYSDGAKALLQESSSERLGVRDCTVFPEVQT